MLNSTVSHFFTTGSGTSGPGVITAVNPENEIISLENYIGRIKFPTVCFSRELPCSQIALPGDTLRLIPYCGGRLCIVVDNNEETLSPFSQK